MQSKRKRFLIIQTAFLGDVILATSVVEAIHYHYPDSLIDVCLRKGNEGLLAEHPYIHQLHIWNKKEKKYRHFVKLLANIRKYSYDYVINLQRFTSTGILTALSKGHIKIGFRKNPLSFLFNQRVPHMIKEGTHEIDRNLSTLTSIFPSERFTPRLYPNHMQFEAVKKYKDLPYICIAPASVWYTKQLPIEKWIELIYQIPQNFSIYLLGGPSDKVLCDKIIQQTDRKGVIGLAGSLSLLESAALMKHAHMNYVNDSGPLHIASAMNAPVTAFFCSTVPEFGFGPLSDSSYVVEIEEELHCRPCDLHGKKSCPLHHFNCGKMILLPNIKAHL